MSNDTLTASGCGAPAQDTPLPGSVDLTTETVLTGRVVSTAGEPVPGAYVRLLDRGGEFTAEVVTGPTGVFRFFAAAGDWTLRALSRAGDGEQSVTVGTGLTETTVTVSR